MSQKSASALEPDPDDSDAEAQFVEVDPSGRYGRYKEVLGKGAFKKVYRAFDELEGIEVAWNQVKVTDLLRNKVDLERLYSEVHLLKTLKHKNIIKFYHSWVDSRNEHINFITEIFTSGNLRQYRKKHKHVDIRALKKWSMQILQGLWYLHSHDPPVIHRDLKCDNIFVNGNQGEVKIGDLGLAAILEQARAAHSVIGTPEFMAPELYEEEYNELVDIYAFGMCLLELVTLEYPYVECANAAQIYKKVTAGIKPASLGKVKDPEVRKFIEKCIAEVSERLSAEELLSDPFLQPDSDSGSIPRSLQPLSLEADDNGGEFNKEKNTEDTMLDDGRDFMVEAQRQDRTNINITLRIADSSGYIRNIHFPFAIDGDTSSNVAREMVQELDLTDHDVSVIAAMIDAEIRSHIPDWEPGQFATDNSSTEKEILESGGELEDNALDATTVSHESGSVPLETLLLSGRKYWSDSYKASWETSPLESNPSNLLLQELVTSGDSSSEDANPSPDSPLGHVEDDSNCIYSKKSEINSVLPDLQAGPIDQTVDISDFPMEKTPMPNEFDSDEIRSVVEKLEHVLDEHHQELKQLKTKHRRDLSDILKDLPQEIRQSALSICSRKRFEQKRPDDKRRHLLECPDPPSSVMRGKKLGSIVEKCICGPVSRSCFNSVRENIKSDLGISVILKDDKANM